MKPFFRGMMLKKCLTYHFSLDTLFISQLKLKIMRVEITGQKFKRLTAIKFVKTIKGASIWLFECDCGKKVIRRTHNVIQGKTTSCGCRQKEGWHKHGLSTTRFYSIWRSMLERCNNSKWAYYEIYGGKGIKVEWKTFESFRDDMYESYLEHVKEFGEKNTSIDRIKSNGDYSKINCRWATAREQTNNRSSTIFITFKGIKKPLSILAEEYKISRHVFARRLRCGWPVKKALTFPVRKRKDYHA